MAVEGSLIPFSNVIAPWNLTSYVFKLLFSTAVVEKAGDQSKWCDAPLFPTLFRKSGYEVAFFTNQFLPQAKEAVYDFSGGFFLNNPTLSQAMFSRRNDRLYYFDESMLGVLDASMSGKPLSGSGERGAANEMTPQLTIVHLKGQHVDYRTRCPKKRQHFFRADYERPRLSRAELQDLAYYDNATRYNDSIVGEIVNRYKDQDAIVVYVPDHGEEVYNDDVHLHGRLHNSTIDRRLAHEEFDIPFWIWCSDSYRQLHPDSLPNIVYYLSASGRDSTEVMFDYEVEYIAKHPTIASPREFAISDEEFEAFKKRVVESGFTYDPESGKAMEDLKKLMEFEGYYEEAKAEFEALENKLNHNNIARDMDRHKEAIKQVMANDIVAAYYFQSGAIENALPSDKQLREACRLLSDAERYRSILVPAVANQ